MRSRIGVGVAVLFIVMGALIGLLQLRSAAFLPSRAVPRAPEAVIESAADLTAAFEEKCRTLRQGCELKCGYYSPEFQTQHCFPQCAQEYEACRSGALSPDGVPEGLAPGYFLTDDSTPLEDEAPVVPEISQ